MRMPCCGINGQATIPNHSVSESPLSTTTHEHITQRRAAEVLESSERAEREKEGDIFGAVTRIVALLDRRGRESYSQWFEY
ncbi:hypothetical protein PO909_029742 [Leuciscus waleckii]